MSGSGSREAMVSVRVSNAAKVELEQAAASCKSPQYPNGMTVPDFIRANWSVLVNSGKVQPAAPNDPNAIQIPMYPSPQPPPVSVPNYPTYPTYQPQYQAAGYPPHYPPYYPPQYPSGYGPAPDAFDAMVNDMRKMVMIQMFQEMLRKGNANPIDFMRASQLTPEAFQRKEGFDMDSWMKYNMIQQQMQMNMMQAQAQLESAKARGDKGGENTAMQLITTLMAAQMQQSNYFLQQQQAMNTQYTNSQNTLFGAALGMRDKASDQMTAAQRTMDDKLADVRQQLYTQQMNALQQYNQMTVNQLTLEMERIKNDKSKDTLGQFSELLKLRADPVYKAAFDAAFGIKDESWLEKVVPQLKELGIGKIIENVAGTLKNLVMPQKPNIPAPDIPAPSPIMPVIPGGVPGMIQMGGQPQTPLEQLRLPEVKLPTGFACSHCGQSFNSAEEKAAHEANCPMRAAISRAMSPASPAPTLTMPSSPPSPKDENVPTAEDFIVKDVAESLVTQDKEATIGSTNLAKIKEQESKANEQ